MLLPFTSEGGILKVRTLFVTNCMFEAFIPYILFLLGFVILIKGADLLVDGGSGIAKRFGISNIVIGLTIVAFGSSAPELLVSMVAATSGSTDLAVSNVIGSNIANILLILGVASIIYPLTVHKNTVWKEIPFSLLGVVVLAAVANDVFLEGAAASMISRIDGIMLLSLFVVFLYYTFGIARDGQIETDNVKKMHPGRALAYIGVGLLGLAFGGLWIVDGAKSIASSFGISEQVIGLTIVAFGTSLPELATSAVAALKKETDIAVGNVVGSNIFNIFWILGLSATVSDLPMPEAANQDLLVLFFVSLILFLLLFIGRGSKHLLDRRHGIIFVLLYIGYMGYIFINSVA